MLKENVMVWEEESIINAMVPRVSINLMVPKRRKYEQHAPHDPCNQIFELHRFGV